MDISRTGKESQGPKNDGPRLGDWDIARNEMKCLEKTASQNGIHSNRSIESRAVRFFKTLGNILANVFTLGLWHYFRNRIPSPPPGKAPDFGRKGFSGIRAEGSLKEQVLESREKLKPSPPGEAPDLGKMTVDEGRPRGTFKERIRNRRERLRNVEEPVQRTVKSRSNEGNSQFWRGSN